MSRPRWCRRHDRYDNTRQGCAPISSDCTPEFATTGRGADRGQTRSDPALYGRYIRGMSTRHRPLHRALWRTAVASGVLLAACHRAPPVSASAGLAAPQDINALRASIQSRVAQVPGAFVGIYYRNLGQPRDTLAINADTSFHAASTMKIGVMIQLFQDIDAGTVSLDQRLVLQNRFASIVNGSPYRLDPKE